VSAPPWFSICCYRVVTERTHASGSTVKADVEARIGENGVRRSATGVGPVHALDQALRACLRGHFPELDEMRLVDYSVSVLDAEPGTAAQVKVLITFADDDGSWDTGYVSENIIDASMEALCSGAVVGIMRSRAASRQAVVVG
jgi:2-isopropylmalate synthase